MTTSTPQETDDQFMVSLQSQDFSELRDAVRRICRDYPGEYWRKLDAGWSRRLDELGAYQAAEAEEAHVRAARAAR